MHEGGRLRQGTPEGGPGRHTGRDGCASTTTSALDSTWGDPGPRKGSHSSDRSEEKL